MSLMNRIQRFLRSPKGQKMTRQAQDYVKKPENQRKLRRLAGRLRGRH
ncbi:hypothetical protein LX16_2804 [Stackebrandtia albiflava]|uniref:Uncharacterized protein n=1 Tax=Stackebrandtia albiflava TaxID=406432 RepID=A0A562V2M0_9ACTN|nr:hypothetical protein [Stackebrandtia albiflava]TWJ12057.1 hypothetical protein LX16_2804 [Stackebrandtia albiflava]